MRNAGKPKLYKQTRKNFRETDAYTHLSFDERRRFVLELAQRVPKWSFARLFAECMNKIHFDPSVTRNTVAEQGFEQMS